MVVDLKKIKEEGVKVINIGIKDFYDSLKAQNVPVIHVMWKPPAGGKPEIFSRLKKLKFKSLQKKLESQ